MEDAPITALLVEDDPDEVLLLTEAIEDVGATDIMVVHVPRLSEALEILKSRAVDAVLLDLSLPDSSGITGVETVVPAAGEAPVIVCTGLNDEEVAQDAIRAGAQDYLIKNPKLYGAVPRILRYAVERSRLIHSANRKVEQARRYTEILLTKVISVADSGLGITDGRGHFSLVNPALAELVGRPLAEIMGRHWTDLLLAKDRKAEHQAYEKTFASGTEYSREGMAIQRADGSAIKVTMRSVIVGLDENNTCRVLSFSNSSGARSDAASGARATPKQSQRAGTAPGKIAASRIQIVGLQELKSELGDQWKIVSKRVSAIAAQVIAKHLSSDDTFEQDGEDDFIICFAKLGEQQAWAKAEAISREIRQLVLGDSSEEMPEDLRLGRILRPESIDVLSDTHMVELSASDTANAASLCQVVTDKIRASAANARANTASLLAEFNRSCRSRLREVYKRNRQHASILIHDLDPDTRRLSDRLTRIAGDNPGAMAEADLVVLGNAAEKLYGLNAGNRPLVAVDVHFSTLNDSIVCNKYLSICQSLDELATSTLVFNIKHVPPDIHSTRLTWCASALKPYSRLRMIQIRRPSLGEFDLSKADVALIAVDHSDVMSVFYRDLKRARKFVKQVHDFGARVLVDRVTSANGAFLFKDLDIDFVAYETDIAMVA